MRPPTMLAAVLLAASTAAASGPGWWVEDAIATGEADAHEGWALCAGTLFGATVRLTLLAPSPGDHVALAVVDAMGQPGFAMATFEDPVVEASGLILLGCEFTVAVAGVAVTGSTPYQLAWVA